MYKWYSMKNLTILKKKMQVFLPKRPDPVSVNYSGYGFDLAKKFPIKTEKHAQFYSRGWECVASHFASDALNYFFDKFFD
jgi:hypothetical protein